MATDELLGREIAAHLAVAEATEAAVRAPFARLAAAVSESLRGVGKVLFFGNGGSACDAQHLAAELTVRFERDRRALAALALTADGATLTAIGNDLGFDQLFARQITALGRPGDVAIGLSTSGTSPNVIEGLKAAREMGLVAAALGGRDGGALKGLAEPLLIVPAGETRRIQEMHITLGHALCAAVERALGLGQ